MLSKEDREKRIERIKSDLTHNARADSGEQPSGVRISTELMRELQKELHTLETPPEQRIADAEAAITYVREHTVLGFNVGYSDDAMRSLNREIDSARREITGEPPPQRILYSWEIDDTQPIQAVLQGDTRKTKSPLATRTESSGTVVHFDTNSDHMAQIDPLAPHWDYTAGETPTLVKPLKPGPKPGSGPA
jgi:hypothetical protein